MHRVPFQHLLDQTLKLRGIQIRQRVDGPLTYFQDEIFPTICLKWMLQSAEFIQDAPQGPDVTFIVIRQVLPDFWRHIIRCSHIRACKCHGTGEKAGRAKISQFHFSIVGEEDIFGLDISV